MSTMHKVNGYTKKSYTADDNKSRRYGPYCTFRTLCASIVRCPCTRLPTYFLIIGSQHSRTSSIWTPSQVSNTTSPRLSRALNPIRSSLYNGCNLMGIIVFSKILPGKRLQEDSLGGAYDPNQLLSLGTTVTSSEKRIKTNFLSDSKLRAYVLLMVLSTSLLMFARN